MSQLAGFLRRSAKLSIVTRRMASSINQDFDSAKTRLNTLKDDPGSQAKLKLYALFKQATTGKCNSVKPGMTDFVGRAKWGAWNDLGTMSTDDAKQKYVDFVNELVGSTGSESGGGKEKAESKCGGEGEWVQTRKEGKIYHIVLNRPDKKNALTSDMYNKIREGLEDSAKDSSTVITVLSEPEELFVLRKYVGGYIDHPKPLVALVNGPAIGICVTVLGLFDLVYASDRATFNTPFSALGQSPEGCASFTFPRLMGLSKASEFLLFGKKLSAEEACRNGLVTEVFPDHSFAEETAMRIKAYSQLPPQSMKLSKELIRQTFKTELHKANADECELLRERWQSDECAEAIMNFFSRSKM